MSREHNKQSLANRLERVKIQLTATPRGQSEYYRQFMARINGERERRAIVLEHIQGKINSSYGYRGYMKIGGAVKADSLSLLGLNGWWGFSSTK